MSRGEEKRWTYALLMAQVIHLHQTTGQKPIVLVDDPVSELDQSHWLRLSTLLGELPAQRFVTLIDAAQAHPPVDGALFHVEQGIVTRML
jgi:DNA replication and repair protein RecF